MSLTIAPAAGATNPFTAFLSPLASTPTRPVFFGTLLLEIRATAPAELIEVAMNTAPGAGLALYGPRRVASLAAGRTIPIGVFCSVRRPAGNLSPLTSMITVSWLDPGSSTRVSTQFSVVVNFSNSAQTVFTPMSMQLESVASPAASKRFQVRLQCQQQVAQFSVNAPVVASAFSWTAPTPPGAFLPGKGPTLDLSFDFNSGLNRDPQVVNVQATAQNGQTFSVPLICWCVDGPNKGEIQIVALDSDPAGADVARESVTIRNMTSRRLDLTGCSLRDEGGTPQGFNFPMGIPRVFAFAPGTVLPAGASLQIFSGVGTNTATTLFLRQPQPIWNNDFDTAVLANSAGDEIARRFYLTALPGARISGQTKIFDATLSINQAIGFASTGVTLEDGDFVVIEPNPPVLSWAGDLLITATGPAGAAAVAPETGDWPLPGAPKFALLADSSPRPVVIGGSSFSQVINRTSSLRAGRPLDLRINDDAPGGLFAWGGYSARVRVFRK
jgi:hypothetical protein